jgi:glutamate synthase (NADPH/NADH) large chain
MEMIELEGVHDEVEQAALKAIVEEHHQRTGSSRAADILASWNESVGRFVKVIPTDYKRMLGYIEQARETQQYGSEEEIVDAAFDMHLANLAK